MTDRELMQQALEAMGTVGANWICEASHHAKKDQHKWGEPCPLQQRWHIAYQALRERLAQPEQEPVAWHHPECKGECIACLIQRAVQDAYGTQGLDYLLRHVTAVTTPPRREWVGLTDEEIERTCAPLGAAMLSFTEVASAIEAKLREKNA